MAVKKDLLEITGEQIIALLQEGATRKEIQTKYEISGQKLASMVKKAKAEEKEAIVGKVDEKIPASAFAKSSNVVNDGTMGDSVVMTIDEFREYNVANGRTPAGRNLGIKTQMNTGELRVLLSLRGRGITPDEMKRAAWEQHGMEEEDLIKLAYALCKEEESKPADILKQLNIRMPRR